MPTHRRRQALHTTSRSASPRMDGFGTWISVVVLFGAVTAAFVMRQNIDDHIYSVASVSDAATTGAAIHDR
ncbi:MAG TPA: hypothetical protein VG270_01590 [Pseudolabrys sp.]|nr:hypothetical protein [Pseudolabrys sp.]